MLVDKIWFLMSDMNIGPGYHIYPRTRLQPKEDQEGWTNGRFPHTKLKLCHKGVLLHKFEGSSYPTFNHFPDFNRVATTDQFIIIPFFPVPVNKISWSLNLSASITLHETVD